MASRPAGCSRSPPEFPIPLVNRVYRRNLTRRNQMHTRDMTLGSPEPLCAAGCRPRYEGGFVDIARTFGSADALGINHLADECRGERPATAGCERVPAGPISEIEPAVDLDHEPVLAVSLEQGAPIARKIEITDQRAIAPLVLPYQIQP